MIAELKAEQRTAIALQIFIIALYTAFIGLIGAFSGKFDAWKLHAVELFLLGISGVFCWASSQIHRTGLYVGLWQMFEAAGLDPLEHLDVWDVWKDRRILFTKVAQPIGAATMLAPALMALAVAGFPPWKMPVMVWYLYLSWGVILNVILAILCVQRRAGALNSLEKKLKETLEE